MATEKRFPSPKQERFSFYPCSFAFRTNIVYDLYKMRVKRTEIEVALQGDIFYTVIKGNRFTTWLFYKLYYLNIQNKQPLPSDYNLLQNLDGLGVIANDGVNTTTYDSLTKTTYPEINKNKEDIYFPESVKDELRKKKS
jgi:hypothetical protein